MFIIDWVANFGQTIFWAVLVLGLLIFIHELGHHLVAKWLGIGVSTFSLGFGPAHLGGSGGGDGVPRLAHSVGRLREARRRRAPGKS